MQILYLFQVATYVLYIVFRINPFFFNIIKCLVLVIDTDCAFCDVRNEFLCIILKIVNLQNAMPFSVCLQQNTNKISIIKRTF